MPGCESFSSFSFESVISKEIHSSQGSAVECADEQNLDYDAIIAELQAQSKRISDAQKAVEGSHASLKRQVLVMRKVVAKKEQDLKLLRNWPLQIADDAKKWLELWESKFGKRLLNSQTNKLAENACVVDLTARTVNYCRHYIQVKRDSHEEWRDKTKTMRSICESEIRRVQQEVVALKSDVTHWELCATKNELCAVELKDRAKRLKSELSQRRSEFEKLKTAQAE